MKLRYRIIIALIIGSIIGFASSWAYSNLIKIPMEKEVIYNKGVIIYDEAIRV